jgi:hypothetical protein
MFLKKCSDDCPLCGLTDSLDHIVLRCVTLNSIRQQIIREVNLPYIRGKSSSSVLPAGATPRMRKYTRQYITRAFNDETLGSCSETHAVALWMARPQLDTLRSLDRPFTHPCSPGTSSQGSPTFSVHSLQRFSSIPISTGPTLTGPGIYPSVDDDESSAEDDPFMARLNSFVSVRDLQNNPGCTLLDFTEYRPIPLTHDIEDISTAAHAPVVQSPAAQPTPSGRNRLPRGAKVNMGYTENHAMQSNITTDGKLPPDFISRKGVFTSLYSYGKDNPDWQTAWV